MEKNEGDERFQANNDLESTFFAVKRRYTKEKEIREIWQEDPPFNYG